MRYQAVFFDAGETLLSPHPSFHSLFSEVLKSHGHIRSPAQVEAVFKEVAPTMVEVMDGVGIRSWSTSAQSSRRFWGEIYKSGFLRLGIEDATGSCATALYERFTRYDSYRLFPDVIPTIELLRARGMAVGLISNFEEWLEPMLVEMKVSHLFDWMVISGKEGVEKPDPAIFRLALDRSGIDPQKAAYVGDHPRIDVEGCTAVGMTGILIDRRGSHPGFGGQKIETMDQLPGLLMNTPDN